MTAVAVATVLVLTSLCVVGSHETLGGSQQVLGSHEARDSSWRRLQGNSSANDTTNGTTADEYAYLITYNEEKNGVGFGGVMLRVGPMASALFVTMFGCRIACVVRALTVFVSSSASMLVPIVAIIARDRQIDVATFVGLCGCLYAGSMASFISVKKRQFGIMVQGISIGFVLGS